jgi:hypothetical protein
MDIAMHETPGPKPSKLQKPPQRSPGRAPGIHQASGAEERT